MKMKRFAGIIAAAVMTVAMGLTAFAAPSPSASSVSAATDADGNKVEVTVTSTEVKPSTETVKDLAGENMTPVQTMDVTVPEGTKFPVTLTFPVAGVTANSKVAVLHFNGTDWEKVNATAKSGAIEATFNSLSPVSIVVDKATLASGSATASTASSPKTGEASTVLMLGVVAVLAAGAVYGVSRKSRA